MVYIHSAYARPEFRERRYAVFHSGASATADIEGVLILGAQGVRSLSVLLVKPRPYPVLMLWQLNSYISPL